jgi:hypothetical protein
VDKPQTRRVFFWLYNTPYPTIFKHTAITIPITMLMLLLMLMLRLCLCLRFAMLRFAMLRFR